MITNAMKKAAWREVHLDDLVDDDAPICYGIVLPGLHHEGGVPVIKVKDIAQGTVKTTGLLQTSPEIDAQYRRSRLRGGDILLSIRGTVGRLGIVPDRLTGANLTQDTARVRISCEDTRNYVYQLLQSDLLQTQIRDHVVGQAVQGINIRDVRRLKFPFPEKLEAQHYIAEILATYNAATEKNAQLIAAKEISMRGWMQKLVMDRQFPEYRLSDFVHRVNRKNTTGNGHPLTISGRDGLISQSHYFDKRIAAQTTQHYTLLKRGEFAYNRSYSAGYPYGAIKRLDTYDEGIVSSLYLGFALNLGAKLQSDYLIHFCEVGGFNHQIHKIAQEGARNHGLLNVAAHDFFAMKLPLPPIEEQSRVVAILGDASRELTLLRKTLDHLRKQKRGLMQKLLTGQWRVPMTSKEAVA